MKSFAAVARTLAACMFIALAGAAAAQQAYPYKPIRVINPYAPGGAAAILGQLIGQKLTESLGQQVLVDNRPGGNSIIGTDAVAKAAPDGYTLLLMAMSHLIIPQLLPAPYDPIKDFAPVLTIASTEQLLVLHPSVPVNNLQEFIALAKSRPGQLNFASGGSGTSSHLPAEFFGIMTGVKMQHIPYKGAGPALTDLIGGQVQLFFSPPLIAFPYIKGGRLKAIAVTGQTRLSALPQVPTFAEAGLPGFDARNWQGFLAPAGTSREIINKLSNEIARIMSMPDIKEKLLSQGQETFISTPAQFAELMKADMAKFAKVIKAANIKME